MFLVSAYLGCPGERIIKRLLLVTEICSQHLLCQTEHATLKGIFFCTEYKYSILQITYIYVILCFRLGSEGPLPHRNFVPLIPKGFIWGDLWRTQPDLDCCGRGVGRE